MKSRRARRWPIIHLPRSSKVVTVESVTVVLRQQTETSSEIRGKDKVLKPFKNVLSVLHKLSSAVNFGQHLGLVRPSAPIGFQCPQPPSSSLFHL
jgi:hypothetical protein